jgi:hypothetical protein
VVAEDQGRPARATFELERFAWGAPDRLEVSGTFVGLRDAPPDPPVLVVHSRERTHRLRAVPDGFSGPPQDGQPWRAQFACQEPPVVFEAAELELGADIVVGLPEPADDRSLVGDQALEVRRAGTERDVASADQARLDGVERLRFEADLLAAQEEIHQLRAAEARTREELARALEDLKTETDRRAADAERLREGLARVRASAEEALAVEQGAAQQLGAALREARDAIDARDEALKELRGQLSEARAVAEALRRRVAGVEQARSAAQDARTDVERLLRRLTTVVDALAAASALNDAAAWRSRASQRHDRQASRDAANRRGPKRGPK